MRAVVRVMQSADEDIVDWGRLLRLRERDVSVGPVPIPAAHGEALRRSMFEQAVPMYPGCLEMRLSRERAREPQQALLEVSRR